MRARFARSSVTRQSSAENGTPSRSRGSISARRRATTSSHAAILTTTNGTRTILAAAENAELVLLGSLLNLDAVATAATTPGEDITVVCAGYEGAFAIDDAYCAGRIVELLDGERTDAAVASAALARAYPNAWEGVNARTYGPPGLEDDLRWCTQENTLAVVPRLTRMVGPAAEIEG